MTTWAVFAWLSLIMRRVEPSLDFVSGLARVTLLTTPLYAEQMAMVVAMELGSAHPSQSDRMTIENEGREKCGGLFLSMSLFSSEKKKGIRRTNKFKTNEIIISTIGSNLHTKRVFISNQICTRWLYGQRAGSIW